MVRRLLSGALVSGLLAASLTCFAGSASAADPSCEHKTLDLPSGRIEGDLCQASTPSDVLIVTVSGGSYGRIYWDFPYQPETYSFVRAMTQRGYNVLNIDRLGIGESEHPASLAMTVQLGAQSLHEVITTARSGSLGSDFQYVVLAGHSLGSGLSHYEVAKYQDVDGLISTGLAHNFNEVQLAQAVASFIPVLLDPRFAGSDIDPTYFTTRAGTRAASFYDTANVDPKVIEIDEATKETVSAGEFATLNEVLQHGIIGGGAVCTLLGSLCTPLSELLLGPTNDIKVPVLFVMGQNDSLNCGQLGTDCTSPNTLGAAEAPYWTGAPCFTPKLVPDTGHDINLHRNAQVEFDLIADWLDSLQRLPEGGLGCPQ